MQKDVILLHVLMQEFLFILGREPELSKAEIMARIGCGLHTQTNETATILCDDIAEPQKFLDHLGGTIKIGRKIPAQNLEELTAYCADFFKNATHKVTIGFSVFSMSFNDQCRMRKKIMDLKRSLAQSNIKVRILFQPGKQIPAAAIRGQKLITTDGRDFTIVQDAQKAPLRIAETIAVQNIDAYSRRDYGKPVRDTKRGLLPPKLAQIMISLACGTEKTPGKTVYDPFCGSGVVLMEALLQGSNVIGSDIDQKAIDATGQNLTWLQKAKIAPTDAQIKLFQKDASMLTATDLPQKPDWIVSEVDLGDPPPATITRAYASQLIAKMDVDYNAILKKLQTIIKPGGKIVLALPVYYTREGIVRLQSITAKAKQKFTYHRPGQMVGREIMVF